MKENDFELLNQLFDIYQNLLTEHQRNIFIQYYEEDFSLQEIADNFNISKNAAYDVIKRVSEQLRDYESKLKLLEKRIKIEEAIENKDFKKIQSIINDECVK